ncbi:MAG: YggS family pyridoxal phosphate-dependent enzyme [Lentisphaeria bacterium]
MSNNIADRLKQVREDVASIAEAAGRKAENVKLVAVSKTRPLSAVQEAYDAGQRLFGENRVQEIVQKAPAMPADCEWHMIGHLQRNKAKSAIEFAGCIHSVDSMKLSNRIERLAAERDQSIRILLETNMSGEESKQGVCPEAIRDVLESVLECGYLNCQGLMTMAPLGCGEAELRRVFGGLRTLRDQLAKEFGVALPELSMGMSGDYEAAIREGATLVRIGTAIFGPRK